MLILQYRQDMVPRLLSDSVYMLAVGTIYICIRLMNSIVLGPPSIASCMYPSPPPPPPPPMVHENTQLIVLLKKKENHLLQEIVYKLILAALIWQNNSC